MWVSCASRPLHLDETKLALQPKFPRILDIRRVVKTLWGAFVVVDRHDKVSMTHPSARDVIMSKTELVYHVSAEEAHQSMLSTCLQVLVTFAKRRVDLLDVAERNSLKYAASPWPYHLARSSGSDYSTTLCAMKEFLESRVVLHRTCAVAQFNDLLRALSRASEALGSLPKCVEQFGPDRDSFSYLLAEPDRELLRLWSQDLVRVAGRFGVWLTQDPGMIHGLVPAFCPKQPQIHKQFAIEGSFTSGAIPVVRGNGAFT